MTWQEWFGFVVLYVLGGSMAVAGFLLAAACIAEALAFRLEARRTKRRHL